MYNLDLEKAEEPKIKLPTPAESQKKQENFRKTSTSASLITLKLLAVGHNKLWKRLQEMGIPDHLTCILRNLYAGQETTVRTRHVLTRTVDCSKVGKEYVKAVYCHPAYVTFLQSTSKYNYRKLTKLITWITALSNSMKL